MLASKGAETPDRRDKGQGCTNDKVDWTPGVPVDSHFRPVAKKLRNISNTDTLYLKLLSDPYSYL